MSVNKVILVGNLGSDPELKTLPSGVTLCRFSLATNERFKNRAGEAEQRTEWHTIVAWNRLGEICGEYLSKGRQLYVEGAICMRKWLDKEGNERTEYQIVARQIRMLSPAPNGNGSARESSRASQGSPAPDEDNPFQEDDSEIPF